LLKYPKIFYPETCTKENFLLVYGQVCTRCFGYGIPSCSMIPMADTLNHSDQTISSEVITKSLHIKADEESCYFTRAKYMNDYT